jgi:hypothetical protein
VRRRARNPAPPAGFTLDPAPWIEVYLDRLPDDEELGFFHVTTRAAMVRQAGALRSRAQLLEQNIVGLGGGHRNVASGLVSFVYVRSRAEWLRTTMQVAARACRNEISAVGVAKAVIDWTGFPDQDPWSTAIEYLADLDEEREGYDEAPLLDPQIKDVLMAIGGESMVAAYERGEVAPWSRRGLFQAIDAFSAEIEQDFEEPQSKYGLLTSLELAIDSFLNPDHESLTECKPIAGFTGVFRHFRSIDPDDIAIVQVAVRDGARDDYVPEECELRFSPDDIALVSIDGLRRRDVAVVRAVLGRVFDERDVERRVARDARHAIELRRRGVDDMALELDRRVMPVCAADDDGAVHELGRVALGAKSVVQGRGDVVAGAPEASTGGLALGARGVGERLDAEHRKRGVRPAKGVLDESLDAVEARAFCGSDAVVAIDEHEPARHSPAAHDDHGGRHLAEGDSSRVVFGLSVIVDGGIVPEDVRRDTLETPRRPSVRFEEARSAFALLRWRPL